MISDHISDDIPTQLNILNMVIPILMHFSACLPSKSLFVSNWSDVDRMLSMLWPQTISDITPWIYCHKFLILSS